MSTLTWITEKELQSRTKLLEKVFSIMSTFLRGNKTISETTPLRKEIPFPQFNVASYKRPGNRLSFEYATTLLSGEGGEGRTGTAMMFRKMFPKYTIFSTVLSKIVEREIKTKGDQFHWKKSKNFIAAVRKRGNASCHQGGNERQRKNVNRNTYNTSSIKRVTRKFLEVSRCSRAKQRQRSVPKKRANLFLQIRKKVCYTCKVFFFLLIRPTDFFGCFRCFRPLALHDFTFCLVNYRY